MAIAPIDDAVGRVLGDRYRITRPLGTGASAHVYAAEDVRLRRRVAIKVLHPALAGDDAFLRRFRAEARVVAALRHPNILRVYDWGEDAGTPYLVMELLEGGSLRAMLDRGHVLTPGQVAAVGADAAKALGYAHRRGLVHRDVKPANLVFDDEGRVSIADFGIARALAEASWTEPIGAVVGTARYAAPEQARGEGGAAAADVYALALVLVEAATGTVPFAADTTIATLMARIDRPLEVPHELGPLRPVLEAAGRPDATERPDAGQLAEGLQSAARKLPQPGPLPLARTGEELGERWDEGFAADPTDYPGRPRLFDRAALEHEQGARAKSGPPPRAALPAPRKRRRRGRLALLVGIVLALAAGGAVAAIEETGALVPSHPVPSLIADTQSQADAALQSLHFHLRISASRYDAAFKAGTVISQVPDSGRLKQGQTVSVVVSLGPKPVSVPTSLAGLTEAQARDRLSALGLKLAVSGQHSSMTVAEGYVISSSPSSGTLLPGQTVSVILSSGKPFVDVPSLTGSSAGSFAAASQALSAQGLAAVEVLDYSSTVAKGEVIATNPAAGAPVRVGSQVSVLVSKGPQLVSIPPVDGDSVAAATQALTAAGLDVAGVIGNPTAVATGTQPGGGTLVAIGTKVQIVTG